MLSFKGGPEVKVARLELVKLLSVIRMLSVALEQEESRGDALVRLLLTGAMRQLLAAAEGLAKAHKILWGTLESMPESVEPPPPFSDSLSAYAKPWRLCRSQVAVWAGMGDAPPAEVTAVSEVFEDDAGTSFLKGSDGASIWTRGESKLRQLREAGAEALFRKRGMGALWGALEAAHQRFGASSGLARARPKRDRGADEARGAVDAALALYLLKVCAIAQPDGTDGDARAERLLAPYFEALAAHEERRTAQRKAAPTKEGAAPSGAPVKPLRVPSAGASVVPLRPSQRPPEPPRAATGT